MMKKIFISIKFIFVNFLSEVKEEEGGMGYFRKFIFENSNTLNFSFLMTFKVNRKNFLWPLKKISFSWAIGVPPKKGEQ